MRLPAKELETLAKDAIEALSSSKDRAEAERDVVKMAPFFLDCTFPKLPPELKASIKDTLQAAEDKFGSLAGVLGLDKEDGIAEGAKTQSEKRGVQEVRAEGADEAKSSPAEAIGGCRVNLGDQSDRLQS